MAVVATASIKLNADTGGLKKGVGEAERLLKNLKSTFAGFAGALGAGYLGREFLNNTIEAQKAMAQLGAVVKSTGGAAGLTVGQLDEMSVALARNSTFSDEAVKQAEGLLLTFTKIKGETVRGATQAVLDLATAMDGDLKGAAIQVGKALNDPVNGISALTRVGVTFSDAQKKVIKDLVDTGHTAEAQTVILKELETEFGGSAAAARQTLGGALTALSNAFTDVLEVSQSSTSGIVGALNQMADALPEISSKINTFFTNMETQNIRAHGFWQQLAIGVQIANQKIKRSLLLTTGDAAQAEIDRLEGEMGRVTQNANALLARATNNGSTYLHKRKGTGATGGDGDGDPAAATKKMLAPMQTLIDLQKLQGVGSDYIDGLNQRLVASYDKLSSALSRQTNQFSEQAVAIRRMRNELEQLPEVQQALAGRTGNMGLAPISDPVRDSRDAMNPGPMSLIPASAIKPVTDIGAKLQSTGDKVAAAIQANGAAIASMLAQVASALLIGGSGRGSQIGGSLGAGLGGVAGSAFGPYGQVIGTLLGGLGGSLLGGLFDKKTKPVTNGLSEMSKQLDRVNQSLRNTPTGYKIAREEYTNTDLGPQTGPQRGPGKRPGNPGAPSIVIQNLNVMANSATSLVKEIERAAQQVGSRGGPMRLQTAF